MKNDYVRTSNPYNQEFPSEQYWLHQSIANGSDAAWRSRRLDRIFGSLHDALDWLKLKLS